MNRLSLLLLVLPACGNDPAKQPDAAVLHDAQAIVDVAPPDAAAHVEGLILVSQGGTVGSASTSSGVSSQFVEGSVFGTPLGTSGPCSASHMPPSKGISAGTITVTGTLAAITATPNGVAPLVGYTNAPSPPKPLFATGASITVQAAGAAFPAFTTTVTAPAAVAGVTSPTTMSRQGFTATWTAGAGPKMWVLIVGTNGSSFDILLCRVNDTGSYAVPAAAFALLPAADTQANLSIARVDEKITTFASGTVDVGVATELSSSPFPLTN
ncbi:MAG: hypothetical protein JWO36_2539 [Myxococcales bacterium]|nr:hypothetical protein [Myxococcales bacterium]